MTPLQELQESIRDAVYSYKNKDHFVDEQEYWQFNQWETCDQLKVTSNYIKLKEDNAIKYGSNFDMEEYVKALIDGEDCTNIVDMMAGGTTKRHRRFINLLGKRAAENLKEEIQSIVDQCFHEWEAEQRVCEAEHKWEASLWGQ